MLVLLSVLPVHRNMKSSTNSSKSLTLTKLLVNWDFKAIKLKALLQMFSCKQLPRTFQLKRMSTWKVAERKFLFRSLGHQILYMGFAIHSDGCYHCSAIHLRRHTNIHVRWNASSSSWTDNIVRCSLVNSLLLTCCGDLRWFNFCCCSPMAMEV